MKRRLLRIVLIPVALILIVIVGVGLFLDDMVATAVEKGGTHALGVETVLGDADVRLLAGKLDLSGLQVRNPEGFPRQDFLVLDHGHLAISPGTLLADTVEAPELLIQGLQLDLAYRPGGKSNFEIIFENIEKLKGPQGPSQPKQPGTSPTEDGKKFVFHRVVIRDVKATVSFASGVGKLAAIPVQVREIVIKDGSRGGSPASISELFSVILRQVLSSVLENAGSLPGEFRQSLRGGLAEWEKSLPEKLDRFLDSSARRDGNSLTEGAKGLLKDLTGRSKKK